MRSMKRMGFSDAQLGALRGESEQATREHRWALGVRPVVQDGRHLRRRVPVGHAVSVRQYDEESEAPRSGKRDRS